MPPLKKEGEQSPAFCTAQHPLAWCSNVAVQGLRGPWLKSERITLLDERSRGCQTMGIALTEIEHTCLYTQLLMKDGEVKVDVHCFKDRNIST